MTDHRYNETRLIDELARRLVEKEVLVNCSELVKQLCYDTNTIYYQSHYQMLYKMDYKSPCQDAGITAKRVCVNLPSLLPDGKGDEYTWQFCDGFEGESQIYLYSNSDEYAGWEGVAEQEEIEPYQVDALEHYLVSPFLAERLTKNDEIINLDFYGLVLWGRTTSGQAIYCDSVIRRIALQLHTEGYVI